MINITDPANMGILTNIFNFLVLLDNDMPKKKQAIKNKSLITTIFLTQGNIQYKINNNCWDIGKKH